ncbi:hypothetical protein U1763_17500 [Sphingomonas sp. LB2R24]|uniref:hypothetical protein n=1 Tax=Sphingomonas sorbitolis TaxID=3096165 RepID=UPI002FCC5EF4
MERNGNKVARIRYGWRCQLCTSNYDDALIEHVAAYMWESRMGQVEDRTPSADAGAAWKTAFREMAVAARQALTISN